MHALDRHWTPYRHAAGAVGARCDTARLSACVCARTHTHGPARQLSAFFLFFQFVWAARTHMVRACSDLPSPPSLGDARSWVGWRRDRHAAPIRTVDGRLLCLAAVGALLLPCTAASLPLPPAAALRWAPAFAGSPCSDGACPPRRGGEPRGCGEQNRMQQQQQQQAPAPQHAASQYSSMQYGQHLQKQYGGSQYGQQHAYQHTLRSTLPEVCFAGRTYACCVHAAAHRREAGHGPGGGSLRRTTCLAWGTTRVLQRGERETDCRVFCRALLCRAMPASARAGKPQPRQRARKLAGQPASAEYAQHASVYSSTDRRRPRMFEQERTAWSDARAWLSTTGRRGTTGRAWLSRRTRRGATRRRP